jgi:hypothetical protein
MKRRTYVGDACHRPEDAPIARRSVQVRSCRRCGRSRTFRTGWARRWRRIGPGRASTTS